jgi:hypothetical protein
VFRAAGLQVATVQQGDRVKLRSIEEGRDFGTSVEVLTGLTRNDLIIVNPPDSISDGEQVRVAQAQENAQAHEK